MAKNFIHEEKKRTSFTKKTILKVLDENHLGSVVTKIKASKTNQMSVFFSAKTHKVDIPFRASISERNTWQAHVSTHLAKQLSQVQVENP